MKNNKKILTIAISSIIGIGYANSVIATEYLAPINGGNTILNNGDSIIHNDTTDPYTFVGVNLSSSTDSLKINGAGNINITRGNGLKAISATNGSTLDLGSGTTINSSNITGVIVGLNIEGQNTAVSANDLTINAIAKQGYAYGLEVQNNAELQLTGTTIISSTNDQSGFATGISMLSGSTLTIDSLKLTVNNLSGNGINVAGASKLTLGEGSSIVSNSGASALFATGSGTTVNVDKSTITSINGSGVNVQQSAVVNLGSGTVINTGGGTSADGIETSNNVKVIADNLTINNIGSGANAGIEAMLNSVIDIGENSKVTSSAKGIGAVSGSTINFKGTSDHRNSITTYSEYAATAQGSGSKVNIDYTDIIVSDLNTTNGKLSGLYGLNLGVINASNTNISIADIGSAVYANSGSSIYLKEKTAIYAGSNKKSALVTNGSNSKIYVTGQALINGNVFASGAGSLIDIDATNSSLINGYTTIDTENSGASLNVKLTDSIWNMTDNSQVNSLAINNSTINFTKNGFETLTADSLNGSDGLFNMRTDIVGQQGDLIVINGTAQGNFKLNITNSGSSQTDGYETLTVVKTGDNQADFALTNSVELGAYEYRLRSVTGSENDLELYSLGKKKSSSAEAASSFLTIGYLSNYVENQTLLQRLGDLRNGQIMNSETNGFWIKGFGGKLNSFSGNGLSGFNANYVGTMLGADKEIDIQNGHLFVGGVVGFTRINPDYRQGSGNGKNYSASLYATYLLDDGLYFDGVLKYNTLKNRFNVSDTAGQSVKGNSKTQGISLSAELGKRFWLSENNQGRYIEPQIQLTYGYQNGDTVHASNGLKVQLSHYNSTLLRAGSILGYQMQGENPANFYVKVGIIRELDSNANYSFNDVEKHNFNFKSGWFNSGIGANLNVNKQHSFYTEADFSTGQSFNNLTFNAGYRFSF